MATPDLIFVSAPDRDDGSSSIIIAKRPEWDEPERFPVPPMKALGMAIDLLVHAFLHLRRNPRND